MKVIACLLFVLAAPAQPKFAVASIKPNAGIFGPLRFEPTRLSIPHMTLPDLLLRAYKFEVTVHVSR
jgi:hypothetical protein